MSADCVEGDSCGTTYGYRKYGCRGTACRDAENGYQRERRRRQRRPDAAPRPMFVSVGAVRSHIDELRAGGIGLARIAEVANVSENVVWMIATGRQETSTPETKDAILGVLGSMIAPDALVDAQRTRERLEALRSLGYSDGELADAIYRTHRWGTDDYRIARLRTAERVTFRVADAISCLYADEFPDYSVDADPVGDWLLERQDESWRVDAECLRIDEEPKVRHAVFFPSRGEQPILARETCGRCPVAVQCLDYALVANLPGIWGDTTGGDRRLIRRLGWDAADVAVLRDEHPGLLLLDLLHDALDTGRAASVA